MYFFLSYFSAFFPLFPLPSMFLPFTSVFLAFLLSYCLLMLCFYLLLPPYLPLLCYSLSLLLVLCLHLLCFCLSLPPLPPCPSSLPLKCCNSIFLSYLLTSALLPPLSSLFVLIFVLLTSYYVFLLPLLVFLLLFVASLSSYAFLPSSLPPCPL